MISTMIQNSPLVFAALVAVAVLIPTVIYLLVDRPSWGEFSTPKNTSLVDSVADLILDSFDGDSD